MPYEPLSRTDSVAIALREWRLFGSPVDDEPPGTRPKPLPEEKPERQAGLWQRVGEYWWISQDPSRIEAAWTGKHDDNGLERFITAPRRQNFLAPPRRHRGFPLLELI